MGCRNVGKIDALLKVSQAFESNGVHLTSQSGKLFVNTIQFNFDALFTAEVIHLNKEKMRMEVKK
jgi:hypothetical protein